MPSHVAVIMDGNRRWARMRGLPVGSGYEAGARAFRSIVELCCNWGIRVLTVFAFSSDNWFRPKVETDFLMGLFERGLRDELQHLTSAGVRISIIGDVSRLLKPLQVLLADAMETTINNSRLHLIIAVNYSGQNDIVQACQKLAIKVKDGLIEPEEINEFLVERELETNCTDFPHPDLLIRTSGEIRISNFLLWQLAYTELYFAHSLWPDFGEDEFREAVYSFQRRQRRYGGQKS
ncbi:dehydrodolichyl diphosphate synthase 2 isoform X2 [Sesamum indicum]|nr:dehydrodolichyl diphosphate synthase 2 isoform X2 [Sesamum indicum]